MDVQEQIDGYIASQPEPKRSDMQHLDRIIRELEPRCKLWFLDGKDGNNKVVTNPNIGYGVQTMRYANGKTREFYRIGLSANSGGISMYILGLDKKFLLETYGKAIGKARVSNYCIKFKSLSEVNPDTLKAAIRSGFELPGNQINHQAL